MSEFVDSLTQEQIGKIVKAQNTNMDLQVDLEKSYYTRRTNIEKFKIHTNKKQFYTN